MGPWRVYVARDLLGSLYLTPIGVRGWALGGWGSEALPPVPNHRAIIHPLPFTLYTFRLLFSLPWGSSIRGVAQTLNLMSASQRAFP
jgi:hypothetical protein